MLQVWGRASSARFAVVGLAMTALHVTVFTVVSPWAAPEVANVVAFLTATQVNFVISYLWTWASRRSGGRAAGQRLRQVILFNGSAALGFGVNAAVFSTAYRVAEIPATASVLVATAVAAVVTYLLSSRIVFAGGPVAVADELPDRTGFDPAPTNERTPVSARSTGLPVSHPLEDAAR